MRDDNEPIGLDHKLVVVNESAAVSGAPDSQAVAEAELRKTVPAVGDALEPALEQPQLPL